MESEKAILLVEDNDADAVSVQRAFKKIGMANPIYRVDRGEAALDFLYSRGAYADRHPGNPSLILLDLNMPGMDGIEVLEKIRADTKLQAIPVVVLTTSTHETDVDKTYRLGANSFVQKPVEFQGLIDAVSRMRDYWFELVILPKPADD